MKTPKMTEEIKQFFREVGSRGGKKSKRLHDAKRSEPTIAQNRARINARSALARTTNYGQATHLVWPCKAAAMHISQLETLGFGLPIV